MKAIGVRGFTKEVNGSQKMNEDFTCSSCGVDCEERTMFSGYNNKPVTDWLCEDCLDEVERSS